MKKFSFIIFLILIFTASVFSQSSLPEKDFQLWNDTQISIPIIKSKDKTTERVSLVFYGTLRVGRNGRAFIDERIGVGFEYRFNKYLTFTPNVIYRAGQPVTGGKEYETRLRFDVGLEKKFKRVTLKDRNRIEQRFRNSRADSTRYRNKFQILFPIKKDNKEIFAPFIATEPFYEFQSKRWTRHELSFGISKKFSSHATAEFFYLLQNNRGNTLKYVNVAGVNLKFKID
jgi:hypothetical protein